MFIITSSSWLWFCFSLIFVFGFCDYRPRSQRLRVPRCREDGDLIKWRICTCWFWWDDDCLRFPGIIELWVLMMEWWFQMMDDDFICVPYYWIRRGNILVWISTVVGCVVGRALLKEFQGSQYVCLYLWLRVCSLPSARQFFFFTSCRLRCWRIVRCTNGPWKSQYGAGNMREHLREFAWKLRGMCVDLLRT